MHATTSDAKPAMITSSGNRPNCFSLSVSVRLRCMLVLTETSEPVLYD